MAHGPPEDPVLTPHCAHISTTGLSLSDAMIAGAHRPKPSSFFGEDLFPMSQAGIPHVLSLLRASV